MRKFLISLFSVMVIVLFVAPNFEHRLEGNDSLYPNVYGDSVGQAIVKSVLWASDEQLRRLVNVLEKKYGSEIRVVARKYYACPKDIKAITIVESLSDEDAESRLGAVGLMGVKRETGREMGFDDIEHPINNLQAGTKYYKMMLKKFKDRDLAFAAYNLGPAEVENRLHKGFDPKTIDYIWKIRRVRQLVM